MNITQQVQLINIITHDVNRIQSNVMIESSFIMI